MAYTLLIIEDEPFIRQALHDKFSFETYKVITAEDGASGLKAALDQHPDIILLDLLLPVMDGYAVLDELRADSWGKRVPVIVLTNKDTPADILHSLEGNVQDYFIKAETSLETLVSAVGDILTV